MADFEFPGALLDQTDAVLAAYRARGWRIATAESCTGGLIAGCLTEIADSSDVVDRGFVTYSNEAKTEILGVPADAIVENGAVSEPVARAMAEGALSRSMADVAVAVTGVAGPGGRRNRRGRRYRDLLHLVGDLSVGGEPRRWRRVPGLRRRE